MTATETRPGGHSCEQYIDPMHWPSQCEVCRQWAHAALCPECVQRFAAPRPRCARCGLGLAAAAPVCGDCLPSPPAFLPTPFVHTVCAFDYQFPWDRLISRFKFQNQPELANALVTLLHSAVQRSDQALPQALLPVPLSPARLAQRGYNQAWELARRLGRLCGRPAWPTLLMRPLDSAHQVALKREQRQHNLRGAFVIDPAQRSPLQGQHVALVDDVMTTGATLHEAAAVLLQAGAARVDLWVLARTPKA